MIREQDQPSQTVEEIMCTIEEAKKPAEGSKAKDQSVLGLMDADDSEAEADSEEVDSSGDFMAPV